MARGTLAPGTLDGPHFFILLQIQNNPLVTLSSEAAARQGHQDAADWEQSKRTFAAQHALGGGSVGSGIGYDRCGVQGRDRP